MNKSDLLSKLDAMREMVIDLPDHAPVSTAMAMSTATEDRAAELSGYSKATLEGRRKTGKFKQFVVWWHDSEGRVIYDLRELEDSMRCHHQQKANTQGLKSGVKQSASASLGKEKESSGKPTPRLLHLRG